MLGFPEGVLGAAWPSMRLTFEQPESRLSILLVGYIAGYFVATTLVGFLADRLDTDVTIRVGLSLSIAGLLLYALAPFWAAVVLAAFTLGSGGGIVDSTINAEVALHYGQRIMHLLHGSFGIGATLGPLLIVAVLRTGVSWRFAWVMLLVVEVALLASFRSATRTAAASLAPNTRVTGSSQSPALTLAAMLAYFAVYVAAEVSIAQWSFSVLLEDRGYSETMSGIVAASFFGSLTVGRFALAAIEDRLSPHTLLRLSTVGAIVGCVWFWSDTIGSLWALALVGLSFAGVFPSLVLMTPQWIGSDRTSRAVGWQLAASSLGAAVASAVLFAGVERAGLGFVPVAFVFLGIALVVVHVITELSVKRV